ncbi:MAG: 3-hydroxyacyl-CoA dehydrogenase family protein [Desulfobacteraceae bacterium]|jgi:3-hydroxybutyryl-CoA dehydrogenase
MATIAVIGAGLMGHGIAQIFALHGFAVRLTDIRQDILDAGVSNVRANLSLLAGQGIVPEKDVEPAMERMETTTDMGQAVAGADLVIEAVVEDLALKQKIFRDLDAICPQETILASNTSVISITEIARDTQYKGRVVGTHFWNPPYLIPLVEVIRGDDTADHVMDRTMDIMSRVGKHPVRVNKDVPGFVGNRLQHALWREAVSIVENGIADAATVDECVKYGFGLRLPVLGPLENADLVGTDLTLAIHDYILKHLESSPEPAAMLKELVARGDLGFKSGRGFQTWSDKEIEDTHKRLKTYLLQVTSPS